MVDLQESRMTVATFDQRYRLATGAVNLLAMSQEPSFREYIQAARFVRSALRVEPSTDGVVKRVNKPA